MKAIDVFLRRDDLVEVWDFEVRWNGPLDKDSVYIWI